MVVPGGGGRGRSSGLRAPRSAQGPPAAPFRVARAFGTAPIFDLGFPGRVFGRTGLKGGADEIRVRVRVNIVPDKLAGA